MAKSKTGQKFIGGTRPPRVQIEFDDVASTPMAELPFVMNVMADLSGKSAGELKPLQERKTVQVDAENFDAFLKQQKPTVSFRVPNTLTGDGEMLSVDLSFESMDDFSPEAVARKVEALRNLLDSRGRLKELLTKINGKEKLQTVLSETLRDKDLLQEVLSRAGAPKAKE